ncbi:MULTISPECIES: helix-turn-helix domain-containing protein [unclassified Haloferax]|jgi:predicted transcriptional regulator|uniref:helix-turn-helix transcriptional regulator n=1 Tax=unclassified Haloferax TaxID=2625095 RepID=UPI0028770B80|nr:MULTISPECIES: helix-turn-helix domain-containing protein [unclassified Haloferax]MDS0241372.1 helix-turn-helix domain-containing protein [Haloferax sp. S2CR25]MDS0444493.1 helix-turn-helix domain-containing protein [Haloferax sp. S2CR25-2]
MVSSAGDDLGAVLTERHAYLRALIEHPRSKRDLEDEVDISRSTLDRALRDLADADLVQYEDGVWTPTLLGWCSYRAQEAYRDHLTTLADAAPLLDHLSLDGPVGCAFLDDADVYEADPSMPDAVIQTLLDSVEHATEVCVATPVVVTGFAEKFYDCVRIGDNYTLEMILPAQVFEQVHTAFPTLTNELMSDGNVRLYRASIPFSFGLWIADADEVGIVVFTEQGLGGILVNDTDDALDWATDQYERAKQDAEPVFLRGRL